MDWAALANSALGAASTIAGIGATSNLNKKNREWQTEQAEIQRNWSESQVANQNAWNYEMWQREQMYNSPENQVQRLRDAGLNPLFYGLDGNSTSQAQPAAQPLGYDRPSNYAIDNPVSVGVDAAAKVAQSKLSYASASKAEKEGDLASEKAITESLMRDKQYDFLGIQIDLAKSEETVNKQQARKYASEINSIEKQVEKMDAEIIETYSKIDVAQRGQKLAEDSFEFSKSLSNANLTLREKEIAVQWYNANTQRLVGEADIALKDDQRVYIGLEGDQVKAITATENALRAGKIERQAIENKTAQREYKWMPVDKTIKAVGAAAGIAGAVMLGGKGIAASAAAPVSRGSYTTLYGPDGNTISRNTW